MDGAGANAIFRARIAIILIVVLLGCGAVAGGLQLGVAPAAGLLPGGALALIALAGVSYVHLRHAGLSALAIVAPLPGFLCALLLAAAVFPRGDAAVGAACAYLAGYFLANVLAAEIVARAAEGDAAAAQRTMADLAPAALGALVLAACADALIHPRFASWAAMLETAGSVLSALIALPLAASFLRFGEDFIALANRLRERRERALARLAPVAAPRWGWSLSGVAVIIVVLGIFGIVQSNLAWPAMARDGLIWLAPVPFATIAALAAMRDWRRGLAAALALFPAAALALWLSSRIGLGSNLTQAAGLGLMPIYLISARAASFVRGGDPAAVASMRALTRHGAAISFGAIASALGLLLFYRQGGIVPAAAILLGGVGALVFAPAFAIVIEDIFPRRATIEARYRVR